jgi:RNA recognition motif-containing protein
MSTKLLCRKCQGNHLTIKCGKDKKKNNNYNEKKPYQKNNYDKKPYQKNNNRFINNKSTKKHCVKVSNLPSDVTVKEMTELILPWSPQKGILRINFGKSNDKICYIDFIYKEEAEYFIEALNKTKFGNLIINVNYV